MKLSVKITGIAAAFAFALTAVTPASAQTAAELQALIAQLQAQIAALSGTTATATSTTTFTYTRDLTIGSTGADVIALQTFLETKGQLMIPAGVAKGYFGPITQAALARYQVNHMISPAVGYFGPITRAKVTAEGSIIVAPGTPGTTPTTPSTGLQGGAGDLVEAKRITSGTETTVSEGSEERVLGLELEADNNSDLKITSFRVAAEVKSTGGSPAASTRLNRYVDEVIVYMGDKEVGSVDASSFSRSGADHTATVSLNNAVIKKGDNVRFYVAFVANDMIETNDQIKGRIEVEVDRIRFEDASGAILSDVPTGGFAIVQFEDSTVNDDLRLQSASSNPNSSNLKVKETGVSSEYHAFSFRLKSGTDSSDAVITSVQLDADFAAAGTSRYAEDIITDIYLKVGNRTYDDFDIDMNAVFTASTTRSYTFDIDEGDLEIDSGDTEDVMVYVKFGRQATKYNVGTTVKFSVPTDGVVAENLSGDVITVTGGPVTGNVHTLQLEGVNFELKGSGTTVVSSSEAAGVNPFVTITQALEIDADETLYVLKTGSTSVSTTVTGGATTTKSFVSGNNTPNTVTVGGNEYYEISGTRTIYVQTIVNGDINGTAQNVKVQLNSVSASTTAGGSTTAYPLAPASSFATDTTLRY